MSEETKIGIGGEGFSSPPPAERPAREEKDPASRLHELARALSRSRDRAALMEYLRLRRSKG